MAVALSVIDDEYSRASGGRECVITSANDGKHSTRSLHYRGLAVDIRRRDPGGAWELTQSEIQSFVDGLRAALNGESGLNVPYQVVVEDDHVHLEYDPR